MSVLSAPVSVSPVGSLFSDAIKFYLVLINGLSGPSNETDHQLPIVVV